MFNIMLDKLPEEYKGYLIRTDFRIAIQLMQILNDPELDDYQRPAIALNLLYGNGVPDDISVAIEGMYWFLRCGKENHEDDENNTDNFNDDIKEPISDYNYDASMYYSAFKRVYNIDLSRDKLHWWEFQALSSDLEGCMLPNVIDIRAKKITSDMSPAERERYLKLKKDFGIPNKFTDDEKIKIAEFMAMIEGGEGNGL